MPCFISLATPTTVASLCTRCCAYINGCDDGSRIAWHEMPRFISMAAPIAVGSLETRHASCRHATTLGWTVPGWEEGRSECSPSKSMCEPPHPRQCYSRHVSVTYAVGDKEAHHARGSGAAGVTTGGAQTSHAVASCHSPVNLVAFAKLTPGATTIFIDRGATLHV